ncbi:MAG TPA: hypothetical protein VKD71_14750 [Gemmataceae bacterium]|nr:hypothetical protein [Gemmataceae bacterium]
MKITGLILALIGLVAIAICTIEIIQPTYAAANAGVADSNQVQRPNMIVPMAISAAAVVIGALMFVFGGKGYFISNNPRVTN